MPTIPVFGQASPQDSASLTAAVTSAGKQYAQAMGPNTLLTNGPEYIDYKLPYMKGHQFFGDGSQQIGAVYFDGVLYKDVPLWYDIKLDQVVSQVVASPLKVRLVSEKITYFAFGEHTFTRIVTDSIADNSVPTGFYDLLVDGRARLLAKRVKVLHTKAGPNGIEGSFPEAVTYFLQQENRFYPVSSKNGVAKLLSDKKSELEAYARQHKLKFNKASRETSLAELVTYYNSVQSQLSQSK
ncbi:hypothetical protein [Hymenobacter sp. BT491]|uniref:hypothetical protein n=1 Tax=Hymenobacter sp. BT491 TaxID=2766779 RepID=UPI0016539E65|nr:hypothetical protein [Hymenobacter sp. BT491]MBC6988088.1 hypothetical protein [Hymenobacter sp. BT491]